jgi:hypothetical protein
MMMMMMMIESVDTKADSQRLLLRSTPLLPVLPPRFRILQCSDYFTSCSSNDISNVDCHCKALLVGTSQVDAFAREQCALLHRRESRWCREKDDGKFTRVHPGAGRVDPDQMRRLESALEGI